MNNNLIREQRYDKNGRLNTKLVRAGSGPTSIAKVPAPTLGSSTPKTKGYKPTPSQKQRRNEELEVRNFLVDPRLADIVGKQPDFRGMLHYRFRASDVEIFGVYSVASRENATALLHHGIKSKEDALEFLNKNGLERVIIDRSETMDGLLQRKITAQAFMGFERQHSLEDADPQLIVDGAETYSVKGYREFLRPGAARYDHDPDLPQRVLAGDIDLVDLKAFGAGRLKESSDHMAIVWSLEKIKRGEADYTAVQLRNYLERSGKELTHTKAIDLANTYGVRLVESLTYQDEASRMHELLEGTDLPLSKKKDVLRFNDFFHVGLNRKNSTRIPLEDILELSQASSDTMDALEAGRMVAAGKRVQEIIAIKKEGIAPSISEGWL